MFSTRHKIGGLDYRTDSDVDVELLRSGFFELFYAAGSRIDVRHTIKKIGIPDLVLDPPDAETARLIGECRVPQVVANGGFIVPLLRTWADESKVEKYLPTSRELTSLPLLRAPAVRARLDICLAHPGEVFILLHGLCLEFWDYELHRIDIFYAEEIESVFHSHLIERGITRMFRSFLPDFATLQLHGASCVRRGRAPLFLAPDGGGKSTAMSLTDRSSVLNDDRVILRKEAGAMFVHGTPLGRIANGPGAYPLAGLFLVEKGDQFKISPCRTKDVIRFLCQENLPIYRHAPARIRLRAFDLICEIAAAAPAYRMEFRKDSIDWESVDRAMEVA